MRTSLLSSFFLIITNFLFSQSPCNDYIYSINFDDGACMDGLYIDTVSNPINTWQIGIPQKILFTSAYSTPNVIVTDTINFYPINDTSSFIITHIAGAGFYYNHTAYLHGSYQVDADSLNDVGGIELSIDKGATWIDILNDNTYYYIWDYPKPVLTGNSNGWNPFGIDMLTLQWLVNISYGDTLQFRFSFMSDGNFDARDGLMFDDFSIEDAVEGKDEIGLNTMQSKTFPNPVNHAVTIEFDNPEQMLFDLKLFNNLGEEILKQTDIKENSITLELSNFDPGMYTYRLNSTEGNVWSYGKVMKEE